MSCHYSNRLIKARQIGFELRRRRKRHSAIPVFSFRNDQQFGSANAIQERRKSPLLCSVSDRSLRGNRMTLLPEADKMHRSKG
jgi:hypothetical protein